MHWTYEHGSIGSPCLEIYSNVGDKQRKGHEKRKLQRNLAIQFIFWMHWTYEHWSIGSPCLEIYPTVGDKQRNGYEKQKLLRNLAIQFIFWMHWTYEHWSIGSIQLLAINKEKVTKSENCWEI